jgi:hypothetical protein
VAEIGPHELNVRASDCDPAGRIDRHRKRRDATRPKFSVDDVRAIATLGDFIGININRAIAYVLQSDDLRQLWGGAQ